MTTVEVHLAALETLPADAAALLDDRETARAAGYRFDDDRARFVLAAVLLRVVVADVLGIDPRAVAVDRACDNCGAQHGRPRVGGSGLHVSVAHSGRLVAVAVTRAGPVGVDVEAVRTRSDDDVHELVTTVCSPAERRRIVGPEDFFTAWTRKEAVLKAIGTGLRTPMRQVEVTARGRPPELVALHGGEPPPCRMFDLPLPSDYRGAVAVLTERVVGCSVVDAADRLVRL